MSKLFLVPTPIGNLEDITFRALRVLKEVDIVLVEGSKVSGHSKVEVVDNIAPLSGGIHPKKWKLFNPFEYKKFKFYKSHHKFF